MRAYLVNPWNRTVTEIQGPFDTDYRAVYPHLSEPGQHDVSCFDVVVLNDKGDTVYIDDDGHCAPARPCWRFRMGGPLLAGRGVVMGGNETGDTVAPSSECTLEWLRGEVVWTGFETTGEFGPATETITDHPVLGRVPTYIGGQPIVRPEGTWAAARK